MSTDPVSLSTALGAVEDLWSPRIVARLNDYDVKVVRVEGDFVWHRHDETDELFLVVEGELRIGLRDQPDPAGRQSSEREVVLTSGSLYVVPRGVEHCPRSPAGASVVLIEPAGTLNVGDATEVPERITPTRGTDLDAPVFSDAVVDGVLRHMNDDHPDDSLVIARAHGYPAASAAEMTGVDAHGGTWHVVDGAAEATLRVTWPGGPISERAEIRREVVVVHDAARAALGMPPRR